jgi:hypothetical protein
MGDNFQDRLVVPIPAANTIQIGASLVMISGYARLMDLEHKRWGKEGFKPLDGGDHKEYVRLRHWWDSIGTDRRERIKALAWKMGQEVDIMTRAF